MKKIIKLFSFSICILFSNVQIAMDQSQEKKEKQGIFESDVEKKSPCDCSCKSVTPSEASPEVTTAEVRKEDPKTTRTWGETFLSLLSFIGLSKNS